MQLLCKEENENQHIHFINRVEGILPSKAQLLGARIEAMPVTNTSFKSNMYMESWSPHSLREDFEYLHHSPIRTTERVACK